MSDKLNTDTTSTDDQAPEAQAKDVTPATDEVEASAETAPAQELELPDVAALVASHTENLEQQRQEREATRREDQRREREQRQQQRAQEIAELREKHADDIQCVLDLEEKGLLILQAPAWDERPELVEALTTIREKHIKPISDPVSAIGRVLLSDSFDMVHKSETYDELEAALHRLVIRGNAATGKEKLAELKEKDPKLGTLFFINGRGYLVTYEALARAVDGARRRIGKVQHAELEKRIAESKVTIDDILNNTGAGRCVAEVTMSFRSGDEIRGVIALQRSRDGVTLEEVHGGKLAGYLIEPTTRESLVGQTFRGRLPQRLYSVLRSTVEAATDSTQESSSDEESSEQDGATRPREEQQSEGRKQGGRKRRANLSSPKSRGVHADGGSPEDRADGRSGIRHESMAEAVARQCPDGPPAGHEVVHNDDGTQTYSV